MTGGLMQLVAYGAQDIYLTGQPVITYFKVVYRRHTNFAMESIAQVFNGTADFGRTVTALISRNGDLISGMTLQTGLPTGQAYCHNVGHYLINNVYVEIGGQLIDRHYADWLDVWAQLSVPAGQMLGYRKMIGESLVDADGGVNANGWQGDSSDETLVGDGTIYVPLQFWFCRNVGLALPLIALQYHEVKVTIQFNSVGFVSEGTETGLINPTLWVDYIYLDTDERRRFAQVSHEYLIEQVQTTGDNTVSGSITGGTPYESTITASIELNLNHPVKELVWLFKSALSVKGMSGGGVDPSICSLDSTVTGETIDSRDNATGFFCGAHNLRSAILQLNGQDRFQSRLGGHFNLEQPRKAHTNIPVNANVFVYSFALKPEDHQPSGTCNFSRIDNARLVLTLTGLISANSVIRVYAVNYNVLRIMSGMGGLAYSN